MVDMYKRENLTLQQINGSVNGKVFNVFTIYLLFIGRKLLIKRVKFEEFLEKEYSL